MDGAQTTYTETPGIRQRTTSQEAWPFWSAAALTLGLVTALYWNTFAWWWTEWMWVGSFYAHSIFVPFFVAVMLYRNREAIHAAPSGRSLFGPVLMVLALALLLFGERGSTASVKSVSFVMLLVGGALTLLGPKRTKTVLFPLLFSAMMIPLIPDQLINHIAFPIQIASTTIAVKILNLMTLSATQQGTLVQMDQYRMAVELPCSGFKTLLSLATFSAAFAYVLEAALWKRWMIFAVTLPLSLLLNALRITMIGIVGDLVSGVAAAKFHDYSGLLTLLIAFFFLFSFAKMLKCQRFLGHPMNLDEEKRDDEHWKAVKEGVTEADPPLIDKLRSLAPSVASLRTVVRPLMSANAILGCALIGRQALPPLPPPSAPIGKQQVPERFTEAGTTWSVHRWENYDKLPPEVVEELQPIRIVNRNYYGDHGERIEVLMTSGNGRKVFHDPHTCSLGVNAMMNDVGVVEVPTKWGTLRVLESQYRKVNDDQSYKVMIFYVVDDTILQRTEQVRNRLFWQMLFGDNGRPSYFVRILNDLPGDEPIYREQMKRFIAAYWNQVGDILMGKEPSVPEPLDYDAGRPVAAKSGGR